MFLSPKGEMYTPTHWCFLNISTIKCKKIITNIFQSIILYHNEKKNYFSKIEFLSLGIETWCANEDCIKAYI